MIRVFCDLCKREIPAGGGLSSTHGRRVKLAWLNLCFNLEFSPDAKPEHVCSACAAEQLENAAKALRTPKEADA